jgi:hypothetical protein
MQARGSRLGFMKVEWMKAMKFSYNAWLEMSFDLFKITPIPLLGDRRYGP